MKINKSLIILMGIILISVIFINNRSYAALQSNGTPGTQQILNNWIVNVRKMESLGGGMGLMENINANLTPNTPSNNVDIHMEKNTEYGAMAILSASSYGNPNKVPDGGTTTGNKTGIVINFNKELVATGINHSLVLAAQPNLGNAASKYKHLYDYEDTMRPILKGDAMIETNGWHGATCKWKIENVYGVIVRAYSGSLFSYYMYALKGNVDQNEDNVNYKKQYSSRAAMVCGEGI